MNVCLSSSRVIRKYIKEDKAVPTLEQHKKKYNKNRELLRKELNIDTCDNYDWIVTVAFYSAIHLVEAELAKSDIHTRVHTDRSVNVERFNIFRDVRAQYKALHDRSVVARYEGVCMSKKKAEQALKYLNDIEKVIEI